MLDLSNNTVRRLGLLIVLSALLWSGCRKEILHEVGIVDSKENQFGSVLADGSWVRLDHPIKSLQTLAVFNEKLYIGGDFREAEAGADFLVQFDGLSISPGLPGKFLGREVSTLETIGDKLYVGGDFSYEDSGNDCVNIMVLGNSVEQCYNFGGYIAEITDFTEYQGNIFVVGGFSSGAPFVPTSGIARIQNGSAFGFGGQAGGLQTRINDAIEFNGELFICGESEIFPGVISVGKWNGSTWEAQGLSASISTFDSYGHSLAVYNNSLYLSGRTFSEGTGVYKRNAGFPWGKEERLSWSGSKPSVLFVYDDYLYLAGDGITLNGVQSSNVVRFDGDTWKPIGELRTAVYDLEVYRGRLFAAGDGGLYQLN